jgi:hypothetical protein
MKRSSHEVHSQTQLVQLLLEGPYNNLYDAAKTILANCKKAQSLVPKLVNKVVLLAEDGTVSGYLSGLNEERFLSYINDGMYVMLKKAGKGERKHQTWQRGK